jgi:hypothetical protein
MVAMCCRDVGLAHLITAKLKISEEAGGWFRGVGMWWVGALLAFSSILSATREVLRGRIDKGLVWSHIFIDMRPFVSYIQNIEVTGSFLGCM